MKKEATYSNETSEHCVLSQKNSEPQISYSKACEIALEAVKSRTQLRFCNPLLQRDSLFRDVTENLNRLSLLSISLYSQ